MGFYGHITNVQRTSMTFDRIYPNRYTMDSSAAYDGVYAGRYVLIEYERPVDKAFLHRVIQFDGILYQAPPERQTYDPENSDYTAPNSYLVKLQPYTVNTELEETQKEDVVGTYLRPRLITVCSVHDNLGIRYDAEDNISIGSVSKLQYLQIGGGNNGEKETYNLFYNYKTQQFQLDQMASRERKIGCSYTAISYEDLMASDEDNGSYLLNFNIDNSNYITSRGYDSTVWQKTYVSGAPKYVMIAELNSVVPILDVSADAPTLAPIMPHFDKDSTNIYYKLHMQPSWGFRIKGANPNLTVPTLDYSGSNIVDGTEQNIPASSNTIEYPSDQKTQWINTLYKDNNYTNYYLKENIEAGISSVRGSWSANESNIDGAIYFNRAGFDKEYITHSKDYKYTNRDLTLNPLVDEITLAPTGFSGHLYPTHTTDNQNIHQEDVNELAVLLPSIGDTIADVWDLIYGGEDLNTVYDGKGLRRNLVIRWEDAKKVLAKEGLRLVRTDDKGLGYTYDPEEVNTLAGVINSVQDIMGMIITNDYPEDDIDNLNEDYIYYNPTTGKYYFKRRTYTYEKIEGEVSHEKVDLVDWKNYQDKSWWIDTNSTTPDYIQEPTFRPEREYVQGVNVPSDKSLSRHFTRSEYEPGKYFLYREKDEGTGDIFKDPITKAPYIKYIKTYENYDLNQIYYDIEAEKVILDADSIYYVPNKYYAGYFYPISPAIVDEEDFENRLASGVRLFDPIVFTSEAYNVIEAAEWKSGDFSKISDLNSVYYLTLRTCSLTEEAFIQAQNEGRAPMLFATNTFAQGSGVPQNYYVISKKYELFTDKQTISSSPGVYYQLQIDPNQPLTYYLGEGNRLKEEFVKYLALDTDIVVEDDYLYFREVVELVLSSAENVVNIADAVQIQVEALPKDLYKYYKTVIPGGIEEEGFRSISALSDEIATAKNYAAVTDLYKLTIRLLELGYEPNRYYYQETNGEYTNSVMIDNKLEPTPGRDYWTVNMVNKRQITNEEILAGRKANEIYYYYDADANDYLVYNGALVRDQRYYVSSLTDVPEIYFPNKYYYKNENGEFVLDLSPDFTPGREYYRNPQIYILNDPNGFYDKGALWPLAQNPPEDSGIELAKRIDAWELSELKGFDITFNTLHGLILRLNKWMLQDDKLTRDNETLQGALNLLNDIIHRIGDLKPGQLMIVDNTGRMRGVSYSTKQTFAAENFGGQGVEIVSTEADPDNEDMWIDIDTDDDYRDPKLTIKHNFTKVKDTTSASDMNDPSANTIDLYTPIVDSKGHVVGKNIETVTLPFNFKTVTAVNDNTAALTQAAPAENAPIVADNTQDTLSIKAGNKWIQLITDANTDALTIAHKALKDATTAATAITMDNESTENARNIIGPFVHDIDLDEAGHVVKEHFISYTLPNAYQTLKVDDTQITTARNTHDTLLIKGDTWLIPSIEQNSLTYTHKTSEVETPNTVAYTMDELADSARDVFGPIINSVSYDATGHLTKVEKVTYKLPNSYQTFTSGEGHMSVATNAHDTFSIVGDDWLQPVVTQGSLTYSHINNHLTEGFTPVGTHSLGDQTPQFGETFNMQTYVLDANGHIVGKATEAVTIPTNIAGLLLTTYDSTANKYVITDMSLENALTALDTALQEANTAIETNQTSTTDALNELTASVEESYGVIQEIIEDEVNTLNLSLNEQKKAAEESYQALQDLITDEIATALESYVETNDTFEYRPAIEEESHEATQEEVDAGLALEVGEKIVDVEYVPAERLTIQELFARVRLLEAQLNSLTI